MRRLPVQTSRTTPPRGRAIGAFSLVDVFVSITVVFVLLAILAPALSGVREATRRVVCGSNIRQIGLGLAMYEHTYRHYPDSQYAAKFIDDPDNQPQAMMKLRINDMYDWDGLGRLYPGGFLDARGVFYCPSHHGHYPHGQFDNAWTSTVGEIVGNYHYRGDSVGATVSNGGAPMQALVADGMATRLDFNHIRGCNVLRRDLSVMWFADSDGALLASLSEQMLTGGADGGVSHAWQQLDGNGPIATPTR